MESKQVARGSLLGQLLRERGMLGLRWWSLEVKRMGMRRWHDGYHGKSCSFSSQGVYAFSECTLFLNIIYPIGKYAIA